MAGSDPEQALTAIIRVLKPLASEQRKRAVAAAMMFLGEAIENEPPTPKPKTLGIADVAGAHIDGDYPKQASLWMTQYGVTSDELDQAFQFHEDGSFDIHDAPGKSKKREDCKRVHAGRLGNLSLEE
eukprot:TRINITY_DN29323_c0_g1_i1.p1 TRINITY_DN29323_c0_g1~~TRINITY_DN29323_c0_g1_i1.p1  ORF type:complete len:127 (+),score=2.28 TRINITY_DN29323_c0_g1_i1:109-489(+)